MWPAMALPTYIIVNRADADCPDRGLPCTLASLVPLPCNRSLFQPSHNQPIPTAPAATGEPGCQHAATQTSSRLFFGHPGLLSPCLSLLLLRSLECPAHTNCDSQPQDVSAAQLRQPCHGSQLPPSTTTAIAVGRHCSVGWRLALPVVFFVCVGDTER